MLRSQRLDHALSHALKPVLLKIENESFRHRVPADAESHFKIIIVSSQFEGLKQIDRHRMIQSIVAAEFKDGLHALSLSLHTPVEWQNTQSVIASPPCQHQDK